MGLKLYYINQYNKLLTYQLITIIIFHYKYLIKSLFIELKKIIAEVKSFIYEKVKMTVQLLQEESDEI